MAHHAPNVWEENDSHVSSQCNYCLVIDVPLVTIRSSHPACTLTCRMCYKCLSVMIAKSVDLMAANIVEGR